MSAELEHPIGPTTVDDWVHQEQPTDGSRLELILEYLHTSPPPSGQHQHAVFAIACRLEDALREGGRSDLYVVPRVGVEISTGWRTALIPDVSVLNAKPVGDRFRAENLVLAVEVWSPGNSRGERETKAGAYADAGVPYFWTVDGKTVTAHLLKDGRYVEDAMADSGTTVTINAAPIPVTFDPADLRSVS